MVHRDLVRSPRLEDSHLAHDMSMGFWYLSTVFYIGGGVSEGDVLKFLMGHRGIGT